MRYTTNVRLPKKMFNRSTQLSDEAEQELLNQLKAETNVVRIEETSDEYVLTVELIINSDGTVFGARDTSNGKLRSDLTSPRKKFWIRRDSAESAVREFNTRRAYYPKITRGGPLEVVEFALVEQPSNS